MVCLRNICINILHKGDDDDDDDNNNNNNVAAETAGSTMMILQPYNGHEPKRVPATSHYHNLIP